MYSFRSRVRFSETDPSGKLSLTALLNYYQDCVIFHTESIGLTIESLKQEGVAWVLMGWQIDMTRMPRLGEEIEIVTNPYRIGGFMGLRNFWMNDAQGERISLADSMWALIDLNTGKPTHVQPDWAERYCWDSAWLPTGRTRPYVCPASMRYFPIP